MGWFGRKPRKVGFGVTDAKPAPPRPTRYRYAAKPVSQNRAWGGTPTPTEKPTGIEILTRRESAPVTEAASAPDPDQMTRNQIDALKKRSPWLGNIAEKMANAQAQRKVGAAKHPLPAPKKTQGSRFLLILIIFALFMLLGPFLSGFLYLLG